MKHTSACFVTVELDGSQVSLTDAEGYGRVNRFFRTTEEAVACYTWSVEQLQIFRESLVERGWELDEPYVIEYEDIDDS